VLPAQFLRLWINITAKLSIQFDGFIVEIIEPRIGDDLLIVALPLPVGVKDN
jgi:hypothetical protein